MAYRVNWWYIFFDLPLATRIILLGWVSIPSEGMRLAQSLGLNGRARFWCVEWPMLVHVVPSTIAVTFVIFLSSFTVALTLVGVPRATIIELTIHQAVRFEFDFAKAAMLGFLQLSLSIIAAIVVFGGMRDGFGFSLDHSIRLLSHPLVERLWDEATMSLAFLFFMLPLAILLTKGILDLGQL